MWSFKDKIIFIIPTIGKCAVLQQKEVKYTIGERSIHI